MIFFSIHNLAICMHVLEKKLLVMLKNLSELFGKHHEWSKPSALIEFVCLYQLFRACFEEA